MSEESKNKEALKILLGTLEENPDLWETRKKTARLLYEDKKYLEAADMLWGAPEIPATDVDVAFALQVISRVKPNRSIRLVYEVLRRNHGKPLKNMAVARALNEVGLYMEAARFYGAALAEDTSLFNLAFERQMLWMDDSKRLIEEWKDSDQEAKLPLDVPSQELSGGLLRPAGIHNDILAIAEGKENEDTPGAQAAPGAPVPTQPLIVPSGAKPPATHPLLVAGASQAAGVPGTGTAVPSAQPAAGGPPQAGGPATAPLSAPAVAPGGSATRPLLVTGQAAANAAQLPPQQGQEPANPPTAQATNILIPGNQAGVQVPGNPPEALSGQGAPLSAENTQAPQPQQQMPGQVGTQPMAMPGQVGTQPMGVANPVPQAMPAAPVMRRPQPAGGQPGMMQPGMPMATQPMVMPGMQPGMPMATQPMVMPGMPMQPGMPMATQPMVMPGMPMGTQPMAIMPQQMVQQIPGMPMATQPMAAMPGYGPPQASTPPPEGPKLRLK